MNSQVFHNFFLENCTSVNNYLFDFVLFRGSKNNEFGFALRIRSEVAETNWAAPFLERHFYVSNSFIIHNNFRCLLLPSHSP